MTWKQEEEIGKGYLHSLSPKCTCIELGSILLGTSTPNTNNTCCCCYSVVMSCLTLCDPMNFRHSRLPSFTMSWSLLALTSIESVMLSNHLIIGHPFLLLPSILPNIRVFSNELAFRIRWPKYWSFSISPSHEYSGLISFNQLVRSPCCPRESQECSPAPQFESINSLALTPSLWSNSHIHPYMTTRKTIALTIWTFVGKVMSLLFNTLFRFVIAFLPRSKHRLISWL